MNAIRAFAEQCGMTEKQVVENICKTLQVSEKIAKRMLQTEGLLLHLLDDVIPHENKLQLLNNIVKNRRWKQYTARFYGVKAGSLSSYVCKNYVPKKKSFVGAAFKAFLHCAKGLITTISAYDQVVDSLVAKRKMYRELIDYLGKDIFHALAKETGLKESTVKAYYYAYNLPKASADRILQALMRLAEKRLGIRIVSRTRKGVKKEKGGAL